MVLSARQKNGRHRAIARAQAPLRPHWRRDGLKLRSELRWLGGNFSTSEGKSTEEPLGKGIGILTYLKQVPTGSSNESGDARQQTNGIGTMQLENVRFHQTSTAGSGVGAE